MSEQPDIKKYNDLELFEMFTNNFGRDTQKMADFFGVTQRTIQNYKKDNFIIIEQKILQKFLDNQANRKELEVVATNYIDNQKIAQSAIYKLLLMLHEKVKKWETSLFEVSTNEIIQILNVLQKYDKSGIDPSSGTEIGWETILREDKADGSTVTQIQRKIEKASQL